MELMRRRFFAWVGCLTLMTAFGGAALVGCSTELSELSEYGEVAETDVKCLVDMMRDPDSFVLRGDVYVRHQEGDVDDYTSGWYSFVDYSGTNGFGGTVRGVAIFKDGEYLGDVGDSTYDDYDTREGARMAVIFHQASAWYSYQGNDDGFSEWVSGRRIASDLEVEYRG